MLLGHFLLHPFYGFAYHLDTAAAAYTYQMIVMIVAELMFEAPGAVIKIHFTGKTGIADEFKGAVHRCRPDTGVPLPNNFEEFRRREMLFGGQKCREYLFAGPTATNTLCTDERAEMFHFTGNAHA